LPLGKHMDESDEEEEDENGMPKQEKEKKKDKIVKMVRNTTIMTKFKRLHGRTASDANLGGLLKKVDDWWEKERELI